MVDIQSKEVIDKISDELKLQPAMQIPRALMEKIMLVYNINPVRIVDLLEKQFSIATGTNNVLTTAATRDTFLTGISWSLHVDAANNGTIASVDVVLPDGRIRDIISLRKLALLEGIFVKVIAFDPPIKLARNSLIRQTHLFTAGASSMSTVIFGYTTDPQ